MARISRVKKATTIASTFAIALGIGFVMQYGDANAARFASDEPTPVRKPVLIIDYAPLREMTDFHLKPEPKDRAHQSTDLAVDPDAIKLVALVGDVTNDSDGALFSQSQPRAAQPADCDVVAVTAPDVRGAVALTIMSECRANAPFSVNHSGIMFSAQTDDKGMALLSVPAMAADATFFITFEDGKSLATTTYAPNAERYNRVVFQWEGHEGAYIKETDTISDLATVDRIGADVGEIPRFAEIYSFPADLNLTDGLDGIDLVADVTERNCDQDLIAESFTIFPGVIDLKFKDIRITLPDCHALGETIALNKILGEQTLAAR